MTQAQFWIEQRKWALKWLNAPESDLPGTLTREKLIEKLDEADDALIDHARYTADGKFSHYA